MKRSDFIHATTGVPPEQQERHKRATRASCTQRREMVRALLITEFVSSITELRGLLADRGIVVSRQALGFDLQAVGAFMDLDSVTQMKRWVV